MQYFEHATHFNVTDRSLETYTAVLGGLDLCKYIPEHSNVLVSGSGVYGRFEKELKEGRKDLTIYSIDLSLGVIGVDINNRRTTNGYQIHNLLPYGVVYQKQDLNTDERVLRGSDAISFDSKRKIRLSRLQGTVSANAVLLPFKDDSFEVIFDIMGPLLYLRSESLETYFEQVKRVLKSGGVFISQYLTREHIRIIEKLGLTHKEINPNAFEIKKPNIGGHQGIRTPDPLGVNEML